MLPESSIVNMMFGFTGLIPWMGTCASVSRMAAASSVNGWSATAAASVAARKRLQALGRTTVMARLLGREGARRSLQNGLRVCHRAARALDPHGDPVVGIARTDQSDVVFRAGIRAERTGGQIAVAADRGTGREAHPLDHIAAAV